MNIVELRELIASHVAYSPDFLAAGMLDVLTTQQGVIDWLQREHVRQKERLTKLGKEIDRLKGVHGA